MTPAALFVEVVDAAFVDVDDDDTDCVLGFAMMDEVDDEDEDDVPLLLPPLPVGPVTTALRTHLGEEVVARLMSWDRGPGVVGAWRA